MNKIPLLIFFLIHTSVSAAEDYMLMEVNSQGLGQIKIGMKPSEVSNILGTDITKTETQYSEGECFSYSIGKHRFGGNVRFLVNKGILSLISINTNKIKTDKGISTMQPPSEAEKAYAGLYKKGTTHYGDIKLTVEYPNDKTTLHFVGGKRYIRYIAIGKEPEINFTEGCL